MAKTKKAGYHWILIKPWKVQKQWIEKDIELKPVKGPRGGIPYRPTWAHRHPLYQPPQLYYCFCKTFNTPTTRLETGVEVWCEFLANPPEVPSDGSIINAIHREIEKIAEEDPRERAKGILNMQQYNERKYWGVEIGEAPDRNISEFDEKYPVLYLSAWSMPDYQRRIIYHHKFIFEAIK